MRIAVNLRQFFHGKIGGIENYVRNIIGGLAHHELTIWAPTTEVSHIRAFAPGANIVGINPNLGAAPIEAGLRSAAFDLFFCPLLVLEPLVVPIPSAIFTPDIQHEFFPEFFEAPVLEWRRQVYAPSFRNADVIFVPSEFTKSTIVDRFRIAPEKIVVVTHGVDDEFLRPLPAGPSQAFRNLHLPERYLYFPGNFWPHKNHVNALEALHLTTDPTIHLVFTGAPAGSEKLEAQARRLGLSERVRFLGYLEKSLVPEVYQNALGLLFATRFEGFGIPLLEAFQCGAPVITSNSGSTVEVAGDAAILVDPLSPAAIARAIDQLACDAPLRRRLAAAGTERLKQFSWQNAVDITEAELQRLADAPRESSGPITVEEWPRIGIVTPSFNMAKFLEATIGSVLSQDYPHLDYIVMDAGSRDGTVDILRKYEDKLRWKSEPDNGQGDAVNKGWHATTGPIFTFLNADDTYLPNALATIAGHFKRNPGAGLIYGEANHVDITGKTIERYATQPFDFQTLNNQCYICQPAAFMLREAYANAGMIDTALHFALDYDLWIRIAKQYPVVKVEDLLATSRMYLDNKTLSSRRRVYQEILSTVKKHYNYAPYEWINGYACYLLDGKDQFFERSQTSLASYALSLLLGFRHNPGNLRRYFAEWRKMTGIGEPFTGHWSDGWISRRFESNLPIEPAATVLHIAGKHQAPIADLRLRVQLDGLTLHDAPLPRNSAFALDLPIPEQLRGRGGQLVIETNRTWRPFTNGDYRQLSCIIDSLEQRAS